MKTPLIVGLLVVSLAGGCATQRALLSDPARNDALHEQLSKQVFRGRWWNLYERAYIYQEFELWELAEADIRAALSKRNVDQRWARTYGLHFVPEYFPNRELGIILHRQQRSDEAVAPLERSIEQQFTARAAFYLDAARLELVASAGRDSAPPTIEVLAPASDARIGATQVEIRAIARDETYIAAIEVGGLEVPVRVTAAEVAIARTVPLAPGQNAVEITATDITGKHTSHSIRLRADLDGPAVRFDGPVTLPGTIRGVAYDLSGIASFAVGPYEGTLATNAKGVVEFEVAIPDLAEDFIPLFRCHDTLGNATTGMISLDAVLSENAGNDVVFASAPSLVTIDDEFAVVYVGGEAMAIVRVAQAPLNADGAPSVQFTNLLPGQRYLSDEIVASLDIRAQSPVQRVEINGISVDTLIPGSDAQRLSRRIRLDDTGSHEIRARVVDAEGRVGETAVTIERNLPRVEEVSARLSVTLLGDLSRAEDATLMQHAEYVRSELPLILEDRRRFNIIDRENIETVIEEQQLIAALGSVKERQRLGQLDMADFMLIADLRKYAKNVEILVHAIDSQTSREVIVDVYGPANSRQQIRTLTEDLAMRLEQEFPRVQGDVLRVNAGGNRVFSSLKAEHRVREEMYCVVYRAEEIIDPRTNQSLGTDLIPVAEGTLRDIQRGGSSIQLLLDEADGPIDAAQLTDLVVTK